MKKIYIWMLSFLLASLQLHAQTASDTKLEIYQIKVSEGHATLVVTKNNAGTIIYKSVLIDAGESKNDAILIEQVINRNDVARGRLDVVMITHHDQDHWGGLPGSSGLLSKRCTSTGSLRSSNPNPLKLYMSLDAINPPESDRMKEAQLIAQYGNNIEVRNWEQDLDIDLMPVLAPAIPIFIRTIAINGMRRDGTDRLILNSGGVRKNKSSAVASVVWGEFSFLIQGDLMADKSNASILRTTTEYRRNEQGKRLPNLWTGSGIQNAKIATRAQMKSGYSAAYFIRGRNEALKESVELGVTSSYFADKPGFKYPHWVGNPAEWHVKLGNTINAYNGTANKYGHACVALVPHHGALTSNHWFHTTHAIIGSNDENNFGHPNVKAIASLYNTSGAKNFYITYLLNKSVAVGAGDKRRRVDVDRLDEMNQLLRGTYSAQSYEPGGSTATTYLPGAKVWYLDDVGSVVSGTRSSALVGPVGNTTGSPAYFKVEIDNTGAYQIASDTQLLRAKAACDGH